MTGLPPSLVKVIDAFTRFPGIGKKTAQRLGFHVLKSNDGSVQELAQSLLDVKEKIRYCDICHNIAESSPCEICTDRQRNQSLLCIVEQPSDIFLFEKTNFKGLYHVLGGVLSPLDGIGVDDLHFDDLSEKIESVEEVIVATNAGVEGDTTALYISKLLSTSKVKITRLARGLPVGGHLEYVDEATLLRSLNERVEIN